MKPGVSRPCGAKEKIAEQIHAKQPKRKRFRWFITALLVLLVIASLISGGFWLFQTISTREMGVAQTGIRHLQNAEALLLALSQHPFDAQLVKQARQEFSAALPLFTQLKHDLASLPPFAAQTPVYGVRLRVALHLVPLADALAQAGSIGCDLWSLLITKFHDPLNPQEQGITTGDLLAIRHGMEQMRAAFKVAMTEGEQIQPSDVQFDARVSKSLLAFRNAIPTLQQALENSDELLSVAPLVFGIGTPANYLLEILDSTELRPAGGFIGNYGIATLSGGRLSSVHVTDVDLLDQPLGRPTSTVPLPSAYGWFDLIYGTWNFRDSNLEADFPTVARVGEANFLNEGGKVPVQGVIAITPAFIEKILAITGPVQVPEYHETVTAENLIARIHYHQLGGRQAGEGSDLIPSPDGYSSQRKRFTALLAEHLVARVRQLAPAVSVEMLQLLVRSLHTKDVQIYFNSSAAEKLLQFYGVDAAMHSPANDNLFIVDANISPNKANSFIVSTLDDQVTLDLQGNVVHHTLLRYAWTIPGRNYGRARYRDYVRVYVPEGSVLQEQNGWQPRGTGHAFSHEVWAGFFTLYSGQTRTITLQWVEHRGVKKSSEGMYYHYLVQHQAGTTWNVHLQIALPPCATVTHMPAGAKLGQGKNVTLTQTMVEDMDLTVDYVCR